ATERARHYGDGVPSTWPALPSELWRPTCDTLHAHTRVLGKLAAALAPPELQIQHAAFRLSARDWETSPLPAPDRSSAFVVTQRGGGAAGGPATSASHVRRSSPSVSDSRGDSGARPTHRLLRVGTAPAGRIRARLGRRSPRAGSAPGRRRV